MLNDKTPIGKKIRAIAEGYIADYGGEETSSVIESDVPVVVQHTRLDLRKAENAQSTTVAYSE